MVKDKHLQRRALARVIVLGAIFLVSILLTFIGLSGNSQGAKDRYDALIAVDQAGGDVETSLNELRGYIYTHMNTQIGNDTGIRPPIQLQGTYDRLVLKQQADISSPGDSLYSEAQADCERRQPTGYSGRNRLDCIEAYIDANGGNTQQSVQVDGALYKFDFVPPRWSPDLAGFSILFAFITGSIFLIDLGLYLRVRHMVHIAN